MVNLLWLLLIPYTAIAYAIHGGELATGTPRQIRNLLCAIPFGLVAWVVSSLYLKDIDAATATFLPFWFAFVGTNMSFESADLPGGQPTSEWLAIKGFVTFPPLGAILLPIAYYIGYKQPSKNVFAEYLSGAFYGAALAAIAMVYS